MEIPKEAYEPPKEKVDHPPHYGGDTTYEAIKVIDAWGLNFSLGNAVKYICRAPHKGTTLEDLKKARWYLDWEIKKLEVLADRDAEEEYEHIQETIKETTGRDAVVTRGFANPK